MVTQRSAFTLLEVMLSTAITAVVVASLATFVIGTRRLIRGAYVESQLSLKLRAQRERVLFQTLREGGNVVWGGLLSARNLNVDESRVRYTATGIDTASGQEMTRGSQTLGGAFETTLLSSHGLFLATLSETIDGETRTDRVVVPVFGMVQRTDHDHLFFDSQQP